MMGRVGGVIWGTEWRVEWVLGYKEEKGIVNA